MPVFPLNNQTRQQLVQQLETEIGSRDPLPFLRQRVFKDYENFNTKILPQPGLPSESYYSALIRNFELSAWSARPPLLVALLKAFPQLPHYQNAINIILNEGPFQCHPQNHPYWVCRVATELPLVGREYTRGTAMAFDLSLTSGGNQGKRVLRVFGPPGSGKTHTLNFFKYLENVQPLMLGVVEIDFKDKEISTQAASDGTYIESFLAEQMEAQVRRRRAELQTAPPPGGVFPDLLDILNATTPAHRFRSLTDLQQRVRWAKELANEFVDDVIYTLNPQPSWWVVVFDNCELAPPESHEFVRRLVERAAGVTSDTASVSSADAGQLRFVLLGESRDLLPANFYKGHVYEEDLNNQKLDVAEVQRYFITFRECRGIDLDSARIIELTNETLARANEIMQQPPLPPQGTPPPQTPTPPAWSRALATAIIEKTLPLDALSAQKKGEA